MMEDKAHNEENENRDLYSNAVRAGKRTYFFDVRSTRKDDFYLTITESKRIYNDDGSYTYKKHKIFIYKEDFEKFGDALKESFMKVIELNKEKSEELTNTVENQFTDISFDDLDSSTSNDNDETKG